MFLIYQYNLFLLLYMVESNFHPIEENGNHQKSTVNRTRESGVFTANFNEYNNRVCAIDLKNWFKSFEQSTTEYVVYEIENKEFNPDTRNDHLHTYIILELNTDEYNEFVKTIYESLHAY